MANDNTSEIPKTAPIADGASALRAEAYTPGERTEMPKSPADTKSGEDSSKAMSNHLPNLTLEDSGLDGRTALAQEDDQNRTDREHIDKTPGLAAPEEGNGNAQGATERTDNTPNIYIPNATENGERNRTDPNAVHKDPAGNWAKFKADTNWVSPLHYPSQSQEPGPKPHPFKLNSGGPSFRPDDTPQRVNPTTPIVR